MGKLITALKWFAYGLGLGLIFAPRSGAETRSQIIASVRSYVNQALGSTGQATQQAQQATNQAAAQAQQASDRMAESQTTM